MIADIARTTPIGLYNYGVAYFDTARAALASKAQIRFGGPIEFLCAHGLELVFKADLLRSIALSELKSKYGHRLEAMYSDLSPEFVQQFALGDAQSEVVRYLAEGHSSPDFENRYLRTGFKTVIEPDNLLGHLSMFHSNNRSWLIDHFGSAL